MEKYTYLPTYLPTFTYLHPPPPSSIHLHPAYLSLHPALWNTLNVIRTKILHVIGKFLQIQAEKFKVVCFDWKLTHMVSWRCRFWIPTYNFEYPTEKFIFGQIWAEKVKVFCFDWKLAHVLYRECWFLFRH